MKKHVLHFRNIIGSKKIHTGVTCLLQHKQCGGVDKNKQAIKN